MASSPKPEHAHEQAPLVAAAWYPNWSHSAGRNPKQFVQAPWNDPLHHAETKFPQHCAWASGRDPVLESCANASSPHTNTPKLPDRRSREGRKSALSKGLGFCKGTWRCGDGTWLPEGNCWWHTNALDCRPFVRIRRSPNGRRNRSNLLILCCISGEDLCWRMWVVRERRLCVPHTHPQLKKKQMMNPELDEEILIPSVWMLEVQGLAFPKTCSRVLHTRDHAFLSPLLIIKNKVLLPEKQLLSQSLWFKKILLTNYQSMDRSRSLQTPFSSNCLWLYLSNKFKFLSLPEDYWTCCSLPWIWQQNSKISFCQKPQLPNIPVTQISALTRKVRSLQGRGGAYNLQQKLVQTDKQTNKQSPTETKKSCDLSFPFLPFACASKRRPRPRPPHFSYETAKFYQTQILRMATRLIDQAFSSSTPPPPRIPSFPQYPKQPM